MTDHRAEHEEGLVCVESNSGSDRPTQGLEVGQIPILISLPELATIASQRATEKKSLRSQTERLRTVSWRRVSAGKMLVTGFLVLLTVTTYWGLSGGSGSLSLPDIEQTTGQQAGDEEEGFLDPAAVTLFPEFSSQEEGEVVAQQPVITGLVIPGRIIPGQVIVQPSVPVLTARRPTDAPEKLTGEELPRVTPVPR